MPYIGKSPHFGVRNRFIYTATAGNTSKSGADDNGATLTFTDGAYVDVYLNGALLKPDTDYVTTTANTIGSIAAMSANDILEVIVYDVFSVSDTVSATSGGTFSAGVNIDGGVVVNESSASVDFRVESNGNENMLLVDGSADKVGIDTSAPQRSLSIGTHGSSSTAEIAFGTTTTGYSSLLFGDSTSGAALYSGYLQYQHDGDYMILASAGTERMRILSDGNIVVGRTSNDLTAAGVSIEAAGTGGFVRSAGPCLILNRLSTDGEVIRINKDGSTIGTIAVDGSDVDYNTFLGSHWSRLTDNSRPTILRGTVMETIDEMCDWYQAEYTFQEEVKYADGDSIPFNKKVGDIKKDKIISKDSIALPEGKKVGDTITHTVDGVDYTAKILQEEDIKHAKCKVSDSADSKCVYGVFLRWDDDGAIVNDLRVASVGTYVVRIHKDQTVSKGDLLTSNGDGTAKKQDDDIIRSKTIGKVLSNVKQETYSDGSYTVPCALYCG